MIKSDNILIVLLGLGFILASCVSKAKRPEEPQSILIFTKTEGYRHQSIPQGVNAIKEIASYHGIEALHTEDATYFQPDSLTQLDGIVFLNTTGDVLNEQQQQAFKQFIRNGGGYVGIHSASDTEYGWPWYGKMVGAYFESHPKIQQATIAVLDHNHPSTSFLPDKWVRRDEWYNFRDVNPHIKVLMNLDESTYDGGKNGENHPVAWFHKFEGGRIFYTAGGHTAESYSDSLFRRHLWGGIRSVLSKE